MRRGPVVFIAGLLLGGAGAVILAHVARDGTLPAAADADLARRLDALDASLRALRTTIADQPAPLPARADVAPAPLADPRIDVVLSQVSALQAALADVGQRLDAVGLAWADEAKRTAAPEPMPDALPDAPPNLPAFDALRGQEMEDLTRDHLLWTYEQVGARFGRPDQVRPSPGGVGIKYYYELPNGESFCFWFVGGKLVGAFWT
jgi:hypothetical protein